MTNQPLFTIITVCFNAEETIKDSIESLYNQTFSNFEYIIIDGNSTDNTLNIIESYTEKFKQKNIDYKYLSEPDKGMYDAMNKGISLAEGIVVGILNSDDWYEFNALEEIANLYHNEMKKAIFCGEMRRVRPNKTPYKILYNKKEIKKYIHRTMPINHPATFVHKDIYSRVGAFDIDYKLSADYDFIFNVFLKRTPFIFTNAIIVNMRNSGATGQMKNLWVTAHEDYLIRKKNKVRLSEIYYLQRIVRNCLILLRNTFRNLIN